MGRPSEAPSLAIVISIAAPLVLPLLSHCLLQPETIWLSVVFLHLLWTVPFPRVGTSPLWFPLELQHIAPSWDMQDTLSLCAECIN